MIIRLWHNWLDMKKHDRAWHEQDMKDEMAEYNEAAGLIERWSELCDVVYTCTRAHWGGFGDLKYPYARWTFFVGLIYMFPKYTLRWLFFRRVGRQFGKVIHEVRNPQKVKKLCMIAERNDIDPKDFQNACKRLMKYWIFLK